MEKWWDNAKDWVKVLICIVVSIVSIALIILTMIMPYGLTKSFLISK